jgi:hypothetical protein
MLAAGTADADRYVGWQGGVFERWNGHTGFALGLQLGGDINERTQWAFETEYRKYEAKLFSVRSVKLQTVNLRGIFRYDVMTDWRVTPYVGIGGSVAINTYNKEKVKRALEERFSAEKVAVAGIGGGFGIMGLAGLEADIPGMENWLIFSEFRMEYSAQFSEIGTTSNPSSNKVKVEDVGGMSGQVGFRLRF